MGMFEPVYSFSWSNFSSLCLQFRGRTLHILLFFLLLYVFSWPDHIFILDFFVSLSKTLAKKLKTKESVFDLWLLMKLVSIRDILLLLSLKLGEKVLWAKSVLSIIEYLWLHIRDENLQEDLNWYLSTKI